MSRRKRLPGWAANLALALGGLVLAAVLIQAAVALFPGLVPAFMRPNVYDRRQQRPDDLQADFLVGKGDLFVSQPGSVAPPPDPDALLVSFQMSFDADGFRRPFVEADSYPIVALGDSYTEGVHVAKPWPDVLAGELQTPVRNLGFQGYGPHDYAQVMDIYGATEPRRWVVIGFFEGNDVSALLTGDPAAFSLPDLTRQAFLAARGTYTTPDFGEGPWKYPIDVELDGQPRPFVAFEFHLWWLNGELDTYRAATNMAALGEVLAEIRADAGDACVLLVHVPSKEHVYFPHVTDPDGLARLLESSWEIAPGDDGGLTLVEAPVTREELLGRLPNLPTAIGEVAGASGVAFLDLTPALSEAAARGEEPYYTYDTHWNQRGHDIAGAAIAAYIRQQPGCDD